ncbi:MAG: hypothetical protein AB8B57_14450 [Congregibacter sp.]
MNALHEEIERRLQGLYLRLEEGNDAPPALLLRLEGLLEAAVLLESSTSEDLHALMDQVHSSITGESLGARFGRDWQLRYPFPQIPASMCRAPVTPSAAD